VEARARVLFPFPLFFNFDVQVGGTNGFPVAGFSAD